MNLATGLITWTSPLWIAVAVVPVVRAVSRKPLAWSATDDRVHQRPRMTP